MLFTIQAASTRSGLSPHVIRIWERRYGALTPTRTGTNRRMYCEEEIERLKVLRELTENGHRIGNVAALQREQLENLHRVIVAKKPDVRQENPSLESRTKTTRPGSDTEADFVNQCVNATKAYDMELLRSSLQEARVQFGQRGMIHRVIYPLIHQVMQSLRDGTMSPSHERIATSVIRELLLTPTPSSQAAPSAPELVIATPTGEVHELGALLLAASARELGWRVTYLGLNLPSAEIVDCSCARHARAVALSLVEPDRCPGLEDTLRQIRALMPEDMSLLVGGCSVVAYAEKLSDVDIHWAHDLCGLDQLLVKLSAAP